VKKDEFDKAVVLEARGRDQDYGYHGTYNLIGTNYFTGGNPYLPVDKHGFSAGGSYVKKNLFYTTADLEFYQNNLNNEPRRPTINTIALGSKFNLRMRNLPNAYAGIRFKKQWSDSVVVDLVDTATIIDEEQTRKKDASSLTFSLGGDHIWRGGWYLLWTDYCLYRDQSHYEHKLPAPANTDQWLLGLRHRQNLRWNFLLSSGLNYQLAHQPAGGISDQNLYLTSTGDYGFTRQPLHLEGQVGVFKQWSQLALYDYALISFSLKPRYLYQKSLSLTSGYEIKVCLGKTKNFVAHTISVGTQWVF
jgi:hypothetical protein